MERMTAMKKVLLPEIIVIPEVPQSCSRLDILAEVCSLNLAKTEREEQQQRFLQEQAAGTPPNSPEVRGESSSSNGSNNNKHQGPNPPAEYWNRVLELAGPGVVVSDGKLLIEKELTLSDVERNQNRLTIPTKQMRETVFLTDHEEALLAKHFGKNVGSLDGITIVEPSLERGAVSLRRWEMHKKSGKSSISYVITKTWNEIRSRNGLKVGMVVQVWSVRVNGELWLVLVKLQ